MIFIMIGRLHGPLPLGILLLLISDIPCYHSLLLTPEGRSFHNALEDGPPEVEREDHVMGPSGETADAIKHRQQILEEEEAVDLEKFDRKNKNQVNEESKIHQKRNWLKRLLEKDNQIDTRSFLMNCIEETRKALENGKDPDSLECVKTLLEEEEEETQNIDKRGVFLEEEIDGKPQYWPDAVVPYVMSGMTETEKLERFQAHNHIEYWSCIRFVPRTNQENYVNHIINGGCTSHVGMQDFNGAGQDIACCGGEACVHEYAHALGLHHEQLNPELLNFTRINYQNIKKDGWYDWTPLVKGPTLLKHDPYDLGTILHYKPWHSVVSHRESVTVLDPDQKYLLYHSDHLHFHMFKTLSQIYKCGEKNCAGLTCTDGGYPTLIRNKCACRCPEGRDPYRRCTYRYKGDATLPTTWPSPPMAVLASSVDQGCPSGLQESTLTLETPYSENSYSYSTAITGDSGRVDMKFCSKGQTSSNEATWGPGKYCIFRVGNACPLGFEEGSMTFNSQTQPRATGTVPSYTVSGTAVKLHMCCRRDGLHQDPLRIPKTKSFALLQYHGDCQHITDMEPFKQDVVINVGNTWNKEGTVSDHFQYWSVVKLHICYYSSLNIATGGGKNVNLLDTKRSVTVDSPWYPNSYSENILNYYLIRSPPDTKIKVTFDDFVLEASPDGSSCVDYMEIYYFLPGQEGVRYCGNGLGKTFISQTNLLTLKFVNGLTFNKTEKWRFRFTAELLTDTDLCYTDGGDTYRGTMSVTRHYEKCLPWASVKDKCIRHPFDQRYFDSGLKENYCRNPEQGTKPWCYTSIEGCRRDYCDVCKLEKCYDLDAKCAEIIQTNPSFCTDDPESRRVCRKTCNHCDNSQPLPKVSSYQCGPPPGFPDATATSSLKSSYSLGETVTFQCNGGAEKRTRKCTTSGWSGGNYVCGQCPSGMKPHKDYCYRLYMNGVTLQDAITKCNQEGSYLVSIRDQDEQDFVDQLRMAPYRYWIGITPCKGWYKCEASDGPTRTWIEDGSDVNWNNFGDKWKTDDKQFFVTEHGNWGSYWDDKWVLPYVCKRKLSTGPTLCADNIDTCSDLLTISPKACMTNPDFRRFQCARTCGFCKVTGDTSEGRCYQGQPRPTNAERVYHEYSEVGKRERVGSYYQYACTAGYELAEGDLVRACLNDGSLTGTAAICKPTNQVLSCNNNLELLHRIEVNGLYGHMNVMDNSIMRAHKSGKLKAISFYSMAESIVSFLILRRKTGNTFTLLNKIDRTSGYMRIVNLDLSDLDIDVQQGDYLGFLNQHQSNVITYDQCYTEEDRAVHDGHMTTPFLYNDQVVIGNDYDFRATGSGTSCRIHSIKMCIM